MSYVIVVIYQSVHPHIFSVSPFLAGRLPMWGKNRFVAKNCPRTC
jgi:hypothetical protein